MATLSSGIRGSCGSVRSVSLSSPTQNPSSTSKSWTPNFVSIRRRGGHRATVTCIQPALQAGIKNEVLVASPSTVLALNEKEIEWKITKDEIPAGFFEFHSQDDDNTPRNKIDLLEEMGLAGQLTSTGPGDQEIEWNKYVEDKKSLFSLNEALENAPSPRDFIRPLNVSYTRTGSSGLIAEVKKASPVLREDFDPAGKCHVCGEAGHYARKCKGIKSFPTGSNSINGIEHLLPDVGLDSINIIAGVTTQTAAQVWFLDSGATVHVCDSKASFVEYSPGYAGMQVVVANNEQVNVLGFGTVLLRLTSGEVVILRDVLHIPSIPMCLISVSKLDEHGFEVHFEARKVVIYKNKKFIGEGYIQGGMYRLKVNN